MTQGASLKSCIAMIKMEGGRRATEVRDVQMAEEGLLLEEPLLRKARLGRRVRIVVQEGEIRILPAEEDWQKVLDELAGCLGEEAAQNYDFKLKLGGLPHTCSQIEGGGRMTRLQAVRAIYKDGALVFADPELVPRDGAEVVVTFLEERGRDVTTEVDPIRALRGRGKGEGLVEKLLQSRREDQERDEQSRERLRA